MKKKILYILASLMLLFALLPLSSSAAKLDEIEKYDITVDPRSDGSLDMKFSIVWRVLDSDTEGPLEWIKIGIPNYHADSFQAQSSNISDISYYGDDGAYVRLDLDREYLAGETLTLNFSFHQSYMYMVNDTECAFAYTPGWFEDIDVKEITLRWNATNVLSANSQDITDGYYVWSGSLAAGEKDTAKLIYKLSAFPNIDIEKQYTEQYMSTTEKIVLISIPVVAVLLVIVLVVVINRTSDPYESYRGFCGRGRPIYIGGMTHIYGSGVNRKGRAFASTGSGHSSHGSGGCACACACACAGGGRAGCSRKDFYGTSLKTEKIREKIKK